MYEANGFETTATETKSRDGRFIATEREWDYNGSALVTVLDTRPGDIRAQLAVGGYAHNIRAAREVARRTDMGRAQWTRLEKICHAEGGVRGAIAYRFTVSRLGKRECR